MIPDDELDVLTRLCRLVDNDYRYRWVLTGIRWCVERDADVNAMGGRPLIASANDPHLKVLSRLLEYGAKPNLIPRGFSSALRIAAENGRSENVEALLKSGADPNLSSGHLPLPPLSAAASKGQSDILAILVRAKAKINWKSPLTGRTALHEAAAKDHAESVAYLIKSGADKRIKDKNGRTPLALARKMGSKGAVIELGG